MEPFLRLLRFSDGTCSRSQLVGLRALLQEVARFVPIWPKSRIKAALSACRYSENPAIGQAERKNDSDLPTSLRTKLAFFGEARHFCHVARVVPIGVATKKTGNFAEFRRLERLWQHVLHFKSARNMPWRQLLLAKTSIKSLFAGLLRVSGN